MHDKFVGKYPPSHSNFPEGKDSCTVGLGDTYAMTVQELRDSCVDLFRGAFSPYAGQAVWSGDGRLHLFIGFSNPQPRYPGVWCLNGEGPLLRAEVLEAIEKLRDDLAPQLRERGMQALDIWVSPVFEERIGVEGDL